MSQTVAGLSIRWAEQSDSAAVIADFFTANADVDYISHSELQGGRAVMPGQWHPDLRQMIHAQAEFILNNATHDGTHDEIACAWLGNVLVAIAFISFTTNSRHARFAVLEDMIVAPETRGMGIGKHFLEWIADHAKICGAQRLFLESGQANIAAHHFFERAGFTQTSIVMVRDL